MMVLVTRPKFRRKVGDRFERDDGSRPPNLLSQEFPVLSLISADVENGVDAIVGEDICRMLSDLKPFGSPQRQNKETAFAANAFDERKRGMF